MELTVQSILEKNKDLTKKDIEKHLYITRSGETHLRVFNNKPGEALLPGLLDSKSVKGLLKYLKRIYSNILDKRVDYKTHNTFIDALISTDSFKYYPITSDDINI